MCGWLQWENHSKSLQLEAQTLKKIRMRTDEKVMNNNGTWIDWQYLLDSAVLLKRVRAPRSHPPPHSPGVGVLVVVLGIKFFLWLI